MNFNLFPCISIVSDMFSPKIKICGITNLEDALAAINAGCDALGFVFYRKSPRYIEPGKAKEIIDKLPKNIIKIGVFVNARRESIKNIARICNLDILQFHGNESPSFIEKFKNHKIIKAFRVGENFRLSDIFKYKVFAYLFDAYEKFVPGGTGKSFNWDLLESHLGNIKQPIFLSGGLNERNVRRAIRAIGPEWVDVSSSVELIPGRKDHEKVARFVKTVKGK